MQFSAASNTFLNIGYNSGQGASAVANDNDVGLSGAISNKAGRTYEIALQILTGAVSISGGSSTASSHAPFADIQRSRYGCEYGY
jgi:acyl-CoA reductase-like NAD-dependent aldehyde dehydrogenase